MNRIQPTASIVALLAKTLDTPDLNPCLIFISALCRNNEIVSQKKKKKKKKLKEENDIYMYKPKNVVCRNNGIVSQKNSKGREGHLYASAKSKSQGLISSTPRLIIQT